MSKKLTSFTKFATAEGVRLAYTFSEINDMTGEVISQGNKGSRIVVNEDLAAHLEAVETFIKTNFLTEE